MLSWDDEVIEAEAPKLTPGITNTFAEPVFAKPFAPEPVFTPPVAEKKKPRPKNKSHAASMRPTSGLLTAPLT
jgi:hypothetical protein